jgi:hypothetical protein
MEADYQFEGLGGETRVSQVSIVKGKGFVKVMFALFGLLLKRGSCQAMEEEMLNLKGVMEDAPTPWGL